MLNHNQLILHVQQPWSEAVPNFVERIRLAGLQVMRTFDLKETRIGALDCSCSNHGTEQCDCQMVVLLVYGCKNQPASLVAHGHDGQTWFSWVGFLSGSDVHVEAELRRIFAPAAEA